MPLLWEKCRSCGDYVTKDLPTSQSDPFCIGCWQWSRLIHMGQFGNADCIALKVMERCPFRPARGDPTHPALVAVAAAKRRTSVTKA